MPHVENGLLRPNLGIGLLRDRKNSFRLYAMEKSIHLVTKAMNVRSELIKNCRIEEAVHKYKKKGSRAYASASTVRPNGHSPEPNSSVFRLCSGLRLESPKRPNSRICMAESNDTMWPPPNGPLVVGAVHSSGRSVRLGQFQGRHGVVHISIQRQGCRSTTYLVVIAAALSRNAASGCTCCIRPEK